PNRSEVAATALRMPAAVLRSAGTASTSAPVSCRMIPAAACRLASVRAQIVTRTPSRASASADARPSPLLDAATSATFPSSPRSMTLLFRGSACAEAYEAGGGLPVQGRGQGRARRDRPVVADHDGHRAVVGDPGDVCFHGGGARREQGRDHAERLV